MEHIFFEVQLCIQKSIFNKFCGILGIWQIGCRVASLKGTPLELEESQGRSLTDILARELYLEFSNWNLTHMRALGILIPGFYTEIRAGLI